MRKKRTKEVQFRLELLKTKICLVSTVTFIGRTKPQNKTGIARLMKKYKVIDGFRAGCCCHTNEDPMTSLIKLDTTEYTKADCL